MEDGMQRGERPLKKDEWPDAEVLYNEIMQEGTAPGQAVRRSIEGVDESSSQEALPAESTPEDPGSGESPADSAEGTLLVTPEMGELDADAQPGIVSDPSEPDSIDEILPTTPGGAELDEYSVEASLSLDAPSDPEGDTTPVPAEVVELDEPAQEYPAVEESDLYNSDDDFPSPPEQVGMDEYTPIQASEDDYLPGSYYPSEEPPAPLIEPTSAPEVDETPEQVSTPPAETVEPVIAVEEVAPAENPRKIALILSGGGARGAFQVGAEMYARQVKGYHWDIIAGVSVGAMNGAMLAMHRYERLLEIWNSISNDQVFTGGFNLPSLVRILFGAKSFYGNLPLQKMMQREFDAGKIIDDLHVGVVSLISGEYVQFTREFLEFPDAILASGSIPVVWPPVDLSPDHLSMVDGGVRNNSPVGDVLDQEPDEIVIINCSPQNPAPAPFAAQNVLTIGMRTLDIMQNEIFVNDVKEFLRINALVQEAEQKGLVLHHPRTGRPLKYYPCVVIEPESNLGETLDFSTASVQASLRAGVRRAREVMGRP